MKKLSAIVPVYNIDDYLQRCLESLVHQTLDSYEIIIVNDGSTDKSLEICEDYKKRYPDLIIIYSKENGGLSDARNYGIAKANGDFLAFIDGDDWIDHNMFADMYDKALETNADIVACDIDYIYDDNRIEFSSGGDFDIIKVKEHPEIALDINNSACNKIYRKALFNKIKFPVGLWYEDMGSVPKLILLAKIIAKIDQTYYKYLQRTGSITHTANAKIFDIYICIDDINQFMLSHVEKRHQSMLKEKIKQLYIINGAELTTLRIRTFDNKRIDFLKKNMQLLNVYCPDWYQNKLIENYSFKKRVTFFLLSKKLYHPLLWLYDLSR